MTVYAEDFGAVGNGTTDDTAAIQAALNSLGAGGGEVVLRNRYLIDGQLTVPKNARLVGTFSPFGTHPWPRVVPKQPAKNSHDLACTLILNPAYSILMSVGSQLEMLSVIRKGLTMAEATEAAFAGTAIRGVAATDLEMDGIVLRHLQILGFNNAIYLDLAPRSVIDYVSGDNINGIYYGTVYDVVRVSNIHMWPFNSNGAGVDLPSHHRSGVALYLQNRNDIAEISNFFSYGYNRGILLGDGIGTATFVNCHTDNTGEHTGSIGVLIEGAAAHTTFVGCSSYNNENGYWCTPQTGETLHFTNCRALENTKGAGWRVERGTVRLTACEASKCDQGVRVNAPGSVATVDGCTFSDNITNNLAASVGGKIYEQNNRFGNAAPNRGWLVDEIPSADPLVLPMNGKVFRVSGTTGFGNLWNDWAGREVTLIFQSNLTVYDGASMHLNGDFNATPDDVLKLVHNGTYWCEVSRSTN
ncbi:glycosyl hydrolase family 28-related protein [uncultured Pseudomonas sp.]|uniref:right-handed parallel beta-helix repeat-containing protein n=1 Tax=uncultured Pseudomonas sp. TaxID=114707 RepID=UPI0025FB4757|nr:glycosyl hydrolase family 28-related protein [uncultured Pseudomonas sp.]